MKPDQERVKNLLTDTVTLLCKNGLHYSKEMKVQGLLGITLDEDEVFVVHINEKFCELIGGEISIETDDKDSISEQSLSMNVDSLLTAKRSAQTVDLTSSSDVSSVRAAERLPGHTPSKRRLSSQDSPLSPSSHRQKVSQESSSPRKDTHSSRSVGSESPASRPHSHSSIASPAHSVSSESDSRTNTHQGALLPVKKEDRSGSQQSSCAGDSFSNRTQCQRDDRNAMRETYSDLSLSDIQSGFAHLEQVPNLDNIQTLDQDVDNQESPFITGVVRHQNPPSTSAGDKGGGTSSWSTGSGSSIGTADPSSSSSSLGSWNTSQITPGVQNPPGGDSKTTAINIDQSKGHQCHICGSWLRHTSSLYQHMKVLHGISGREAIIRSCSIYACPIPGCGKRFKHDGSLYTHKRNVHGFPKYSKILNLDSE